MHKFSGRVYFGDTDAAGVVYHARYVYWLEAARIELLDSLGHPYSALQNQSIGLIPVDLSLSYRSPLVFSDYFTVLTSLKKLSKASFVLSCVIQKTNPGEDAIDAVLAEVKLGCLDESTWKPIALPEGLAKAFSSCL